MKTVIVDDEPLAREGLELHVQEVADIELLDQFGHPSDAIAFLEKNEVDLLFLDVEMPDMSGIDLLKSLQDPPMTVLTTAYTDYALEGFDLGVIDYLVKPIRLERFMAAVNKAREYLRLQELSNQSEHIPDQDHIFLKADRKYIKVFLEDILYIQGMKDYVMVYTEDSRIITAMNMKTINSQLDSSRFVRVSKSYIINVSKIVEVKNNAVMIQDNEIPMGKKYKDHFLDNYIKNRLLQR
ncbi:MAG: response regulator [Bacteroidetes bacterium]|nr:response regulator [Bacteroidota bacterium]